MRLFNRVATKKQLVKFMLIVCGTLVVSMYVIPINTFKDSVNKSEISKEHIPLEVKRYANTWSMKTGKHAVSRAASVTSGRQDAERLILEFVIERKLRVKTSDPSHKVIPGFDMYNRDNTPGYFKRRNWHWTLTRLGEYSSTVYAIPPDEIPEQRLPMVFVLGVSHCGAVTLTEYMRMHPHIVSVSPAVRYFDLDENLVRGLDWYKSQMPLSFNDQVTTEMNPSYFWDHRAPRKIYKLNRNMKFVLVLRDPVQRLLSVASTLFHVLEYEDLTKRPESVLRDIEDFLEIPHKITTHNFYYNTTINRFCSQPFHIQGTICPRPENGQGRMTLSEEQLLYEFYSTYNDELFSVLGRRFEWQMSLNQRSL